MHDEVVSIKNHIMIKTYLFTRDKSFKFIIYNTKTN